MKEMAKKKKGFGPVSKLSSINYELFLARFFPLIFPLDKAVPVAIVPAVGTGETLDALFPEPVDATPAGAMGDFDVVGRPRFFPVLEGEERLEIDVVGADGTEG